MSSLRDAHQDDKERRDHSDDQGAPGSEASAGPAECAAAFDLDGLSVCSQDFNDLLDWLASYTPTLPSDPRIATDSPTQSLDRHSLLPPLTSRPESFASYTTTGVQLLPQSQCSDH